MKQNAPAQAGVTGERRADAMPPERLASLLARILLFYVVWLAVAGAEAPERWVGIPAALVSGWLSAKLLPGHGLRWRPAGLLRLGACFIRDSLVAGGDIARVVLRPQLRIQPGFVAHRTRIPGEALRAFYRSYNSLTPGTLAVEPEPDGSPVFHALDTRQPVAESLAANEAVLLRAITTDQGGAHG